MMCVFLLVLFFASTESAYEQTFFVSRVEQRDVSNSKNTSEKCVCDRFVEDDGQEEIECKCYRLMEIPSDLHENCTKLVVTDSLITFLRSDGLRPYRSTLKDITLGYLPYLRVIEDSTFADIPNLRTLYISHAPQLKVLHNLLMGVTSTRFSTLRIAHTGLHEVPDLSHLPPSDNIMHLLELDSNKIEKLSANSVKIKAAQVTLNYNEITVVEDFAFNGSQIAKLNLQGNSRLTKLEPKAFKGLQSLRELDLSGTSIEQLPVEGLGALEILRIEDAPSMKVIPSIYDLKSLQVARLTHSFHCCAFKYPEQHNPRRHAQYEAEEKIRKSCGGKGSISDTGQISINRRRKRRSHGDNYSPSHFQSNILMGYEEIPDQPSSHRDWPPALDHPRDNPNLSQDHSNLNPLRGKTIDREEAHSTEVNHGDEETFFEVGNVTNATFLCGSFTYRNHSVKCSPEPNALNPCEDIMGFSWLRISVWFVVVLAVVGNLAVIVVVLFSGGELTVSRFLMCNLAFADFCMGLYLLLIASMDLHSVGSYFNYAFDWQYGIGCKLAGFLTVFASHLSIFTLTIVTLERWFAITYAIQLTMRIRIGPAAQIMLGGWLYSILAAALPLLGISNYSSTSICLPMEVNRVVDRAYLFAVIIVNGIAFVLIVFCYAQIYLSLGYETRHSSSRGELTVAKKMALLVFTDFATWAPIWFFGLTALAGYPLIGVTKSKILLVFFYPINSCANPYLYAIMTAQYRRDFFILISRCGMCKRRAQRYALAPSSNHSHPIPLLAKSNGHCDLVKANTSDTFV